MLNLNGDILEISLPEGKSQEELITLLKEEFSLIEKTLYGLNIKLNGRVTTGMSLWLGHKLAHICKSVSIFDPKENDYIKVINH
jgi:hypothetical protein